MFDSMSASKSIKDMYDVGMTDNSLVLIEKLSRNITKKINTPYGETEAVLLPAVVAQGNLLAPLQVSVHVDIIGKVQLEEEEERLEAGLEGNL
jgi:hypothetical protein